MSHSPIQKVHSAAATRNGTSPWRSIAIVNTGLVVKSKPGQIYTINAHNLNAAVRYLKVYDKATAASSSDTPVMTIPLPPGAMPSMAFDTGVEFSTGISVRATTGLADNDNTAPTSGETIVTITYK